MIGLGSDKNIPKLLSTTKQLFGQIIVLVDYKILPAVSKIRWQMQYCVISKMSPQFFSHSDQAASDLVPSSFLAMHIFLFFSDQPSKVRFSFLQCFDFFRQMSNNRRSWKKHIPLRVLFSIQASRCCFKTFNSKQLYDGRFEDYVCQGWFPLKPFKAISRILILLLFVSWS